MPRTIPQKTFAFDSELLERVDDFRFKFRFLSRTEAIRWLLKWALDGNPRPTKEESREGVGQRG